MAALPTSANIFFRIWWRAKSPLSDVLERFNSTWPLTPNSGLCVFVHVLPRQIRAFDASHGVYPSLTPHFQQAESRICQEFAGCDPALLLLSLPWLAGTACCPRSRGCQHVGRGWGGGGGMGASLSYIGSWYLFGLFQTPLHTCLSRFVLGGRCLVWPFCSDVGWFFCQRTGNTRTVKSARSFKHGLILQSLRLRWCSQN